MPAKKKLLQKIVAKKQLKESNKKVARKEVILNEVELLKKARSGLSFFFLV